MGWTDDHNLEAATRLQFRELNHHDIATKRHDEVLTFFLPFSLIQKIGFKIYKK
jgi:hypothetical protein